MVLGVGVFLGLLMARTPAGTVAKKSRVQAVTVSSSAHYDGPIFIEANGLVVPHREIIMAAEVPGTIGKKADECQSGRWVKKGTTLLKIDDRDLNLTVKRLTSELKQAETQLKEIDTEIQNAGALVTLVEGDLQLQEREYNRLQRLRGSISESELDQAGIKVNQAKNAVLTQKHQLNLLTTRRARIEAAGELAGFQLEKAELDVTRTEIKAPSDGVIVMEEVEEGTYVQPGSRLLVFEDTTKAEIAFNLTVDELYWIMLDSKSLTLPAAEEGGSFFRLPPIDNVVVEFEVEGTVLKWNGRLDGFSSYGVDEQTRNVPCRVVVDEPFVELNRGLGTLRRGMFVRLKIPVEPSVKMVRFPASALSAANKVWVVRDDVLHGYEVKVAGRINDQQLHAIDSSVPVTASIRESSSSQIDDEFFWVIALGDDEGLRSGDAVVDSPLTLPYNGMEVKVETVQDRLMETVPAISSTARPPSS